MAMFDCDDDRPEDYYRGEPLAPLADWMGAAREEPARPDSPGCGTSAEAWGRAFEALARPPATDELGLEVPSATFREAWRQVRGVEMRPDQIRLWRSIIYAKAAELARQEGRALDAARSAARRQ